MDVVLFTAEEPLYLPRYLEPVVEAHGEVIDAVFIAPPTTRTTVELRRQFRAFGPVSFLRMGARFARGRLLDTLPVELGRRLTGRYHGVATLAADYDIPVRRVGDVSASGFIRHVDELDPDVVLSIVCGQKLPPEILEIADVALNVHGSLLPKYRGRAVAFWPLYYGDEATGVTAHVMAEEFDAGPIVEQRAFDLADDDSMHDVSLKLADAGANLAVDLLDRLPGDLDPRPNLTGTEDYHTLPTPTERREFLERGNRFV